MTDRSGQPAAKHDPRTCQPYASLRHPAQAANGRALTQHLAEHPFPRQTPQ